MDTFKHRLNHTADRLSAHVCTIPSATVTQAIAAAGADCVMIDMEHGAVDYASAHAMIAATQGTKCAPLVRVAENDPVQVKRVLDLGAQGICFPLIRTAEDARRAVASLRYPPHGNRGFGPFIAHSGAGVPLLDYKDAVDGTLTCMLLIETADAIENLDEIAAVDGVDVMIAAQFDLSTDLGISGQFDHPTFQAAMNKIENVAKRNGVPLGGVALSQDKANALLARGYRLICGFDLLWLKARAAETQSWLTSA